jgi:hypothetical protein
MPGWHRKITDDSACECGSSDKKNAALFRSVFNFCRRQTQSPTDKGEVSAVRNANDMIASDARDC